MNIQFENYKDELNILAEQHHAKPKNNEITQKLTEHWKQIQTLFPVLAKTCKIPYHHITILKKDKDPNKDKEFIINRLCEKGNSFINVLLFGTFKESNQELKSLPLEEQLNDISDDVISAYCHYVNTDEVPDVTKWTTKQLVDLFRLSDIWDESVLRELCLRQKHFEVYFSKGGELSGLHLTPKADPDYIPLVIFPYQNMSFEFELNKEAEKLTKKWFEQRPDFFRIRLIVKSIKALDAVKCLQNWGESTRSKIILLDWNKAENISDEIINKTAFYLKNLESLNLSKQSNVTSAIVFKFSQMSLKGSTDIASLKNLTSLNLDRCYNISDLDIDILKDLKFLIFLSLAQCTKITDKALKLIGENFLNLKELNLSQCTKITPIGIGTIAKYLEKLQVLNFDDCNLNDEAINALCCGKLSDLISLYLSRCSEITDEALKSIGKKFLKLTELNVFKCSKITTIGIDAIATGSTNLKVLNFSECELDNQATNTLFGKLFDLTSLNLSGCSKVTGEGWPLLKNDLPNLTELDLDDCKITNLAIQGIGERFKNLKVLKLSNCKDITNTELNFISENLIHLTVLSLHKNDQITDEGVIPIALNLKNLTWLDLDGYLSDGITDESVSAIAKNLKNLIYLNLSLNRKITDIGAIQIGFNLKNLITLYLRWCKITNDGVKYLTENLKNLAHLKVYNYPDLSFEFIKEIKNNYKHIKIDY